jgi:hypothetical protein
MKRTTILRGIGVIGIVAIYAVFAFSSPDLGIESLAITVAGVVALISPEVLESLPFGPGGKD